MGEEIEIRDSLDDLVWLYVYLKSGTYMPIGPIQRGAAMTVIKNWFMAKESCMHGAMPPIRFMENGTIAGIHINRKTKQQLADHWIIEWASVCGMIIRELNMDEQDELEKIQRESQKIQLELQREHLKEMRKQNRDESWKDDNDE